MKAPCYFLMSLDLEDARLFAPQGHLYPSRIEANLTHFLDFLHLNKLPCTFFTVGHIFKDHPNLIKKIIANGFEIGWHSDSHLPLTQMTQSDFENDLKKATYYENEFGVKFGGYRAPFFSATIRTPWIHESLNKYGYKYSSSILPAPNPLYGWPEFGNSIKKLNGIYEIPISLLKPFSVPYGGTYMRIIPSFILNKLVAQLVKSEEYIATYLHPYDFDDKQERYFHGGIGNNYIFNYLMYYNRKGLLNKLASSMEIKAKKEYLILDYGQFTKKVLESNPC